MLEKILKFERPVNGVLVEQRANDGYVNATSLAKAHQLGGGQRRDVSEWLENAATKRSVDHLSLKTGIPAFKLVQAKPGRYGGTWIHPRLSVRFAIWLSDDFGFLVEEWVEEWLTTGQKPITFTLDQEWSSYQQRYDIRLDLKDNLRPALMILSAQWAESNDFNPRSVCIEVHDAMNERIQGIRSRDFKRKYGISISELIRDYFGTEPLSVYAAINKLSINLIVDDLMEPVAAVHKACDVYLSRSYSPKIIPIAENLYSQGRRLRATRIKRKLQQGRQLSLFGDSEVS